MKYQSNILESTPWSISIDLWSDFSKIAKQIMLNDIRPYITESGKVIKETSMEPLQLIAQELEKAGIPCVPENLLMHHQCYTIKETSRKWIRQLE